MKIFVSILGSGKIVSYLGIVKNHVSLEEKYKTEVSHALLLYHKPFDHLTIFK